MEDEKSLQIKLISNDEKTFVVDQDVAFKSRLIDNMCGQLRITEDFELPLPGVDGETLEKILEYCEKYRAEPYVPKGQDEDQRVHLTEGHKRYMAVPNAFLHKLLLGADYLDVPGLVDIITQKVANMINCRSAEEIREIYDLPDNLPEEQKEEIRRAYAFLDEGREE